MLGRRVSFPCLWAQGPPPPLLTERWTGHFYFLLTCLSLRQQIRSRGTRVSGATEANQPQRRCEAGRSVLRVPPQLGAVCPQCPPDGAQATHCPLCRILFPWDPYSSPRGQGAAGTGWPVPNPVPLEQSRSRSEAPPAYPRANAVCVLPVEPPGRAARIAAWQTPPGRSRSSPARRSSLPHGRGVARARPAPVSPGDPRIRAWRLQPRRPPVPFSLQAFTTFLCLYGMVWYAEHCGHRGKVGGGGRARGQGPGGASAGS